MQGTEETVVFRIPSHQLNHDCKKVLFHYIPFIRPIYRMNDNFESWKADLGKAPLICCTSSLIFEQLLLFHLVSVHSLPSWDDTAYKNESIFSTNTRFVIYDYPTLTSAEFTGETRVQNL